MPESPLTLPALCSELHEDYERTIVPLFAKVARRSFAWRALAASSRVIDVACEPGPLILIVAPRVRPRAAVDFVASMLGLLQKKCGDAGCRLWT